MLTSWDLETGTTFEMAGPFTIPLTAIPLVFEVKKSCSGEESFRDPQSFSKEKFWQNAVITLADGSLLTKDDKYITFSKENSWQLLKSYPESIGLKINFNQSLLINIQNKRQLVTSSEITLSFKEGKYEIEPSVGICIVPKELIKAEISIYATLNKEDWSRGRSLSIYKNSDLNMQKPDEWQSVSLQDIGGGKYQITINVAGVTSYPTPYRTFTLKARGDYPAIFGQYQFDGKDFTFLIKKSGEQQLQLAKEYEKELRVQSNEEAPVADENDSPHDVTLTGRLNFPDAWFHDTYQVDFVPVPLKYRILAGDSVLGEASAKDLDNSNVEWQLTISAAQANNTLVEAMKKSIRVQIILEDVLQAEFSQTSINAEDESKFKVAKIEVPEFGLNTNLPIIGQINFENRWLQKMHLKEPKLAMYLGNKKLAQCSLAPGMGNMMNWECDIQNEVMRTLRHADIKRLKEDKYTFMLQSENKEMQIWPPDSW